MCSDAFSTKHNWSFFMAKESVFFSHSALRAIFPSIFMFGSFGFIWFLWHSLHFYFHLLRNTFWMCWLFPTMIAMIWSIWFNATDLLKYSRNYASWSRPRAALLKSSIVMIWNEMIVFRCFFLCVDFWLSFVVVSCFLVNMNHINASYENLSINLIHDVLCIGLQNTGSKMS